MSDNPRMEHPDTAAGERAHMVEAGIAPQLDEKLATLRDRIVEAFGDLEVAGFRGELTLLVDPERLLDVLRFCRDEPQVACELLADLSGVHWPGEARERAAQETTGWPVYREEAAPGRIELDYVLYSVQHNHRLRLRVVVPDDDPHIASATSLYASANMMERETYDFFGVRFDGHPNLRRVLMPDDWEGYPHRKDYPLGGVDVQYKGAVVPPPDQRQY